MCRNPMATDASSSSPIMDDDRHMKLLYIDLKNRGYHLFFLESMLRVILFKKSTSMSFGIIIVENGIAFP